jgi:2-iminobutanoate/2-iminopropanoate deaminase
MKNIIEAACGTSDNIAKVIVYLKEFKHREIVNKEWAVMFPDEGNRPARHVMNTSDLRGKTLIQLDVAACYNESYRRSLYAERAFQLQAWSPVGLTIDLIS